MKKIFILSMCIFILLCGELFSAEVRNVTAEQVDKGVLFKFDIRGREEKTDIVLNLSINKKEYQAHDLSLTGDFGKGVSAGKNKKVFWDVLKDFNKGLRGNLSWEIFARNDYNTEKPVLTDRDKDSSASTTHKKADVPKKKEKKEHFVPLPSF